MSAKPTAFIRTPNGIRIVGQQATFHLTYGELHRLNGFVASGSIASTAALRRNQDKKAATVTGASTEDLERELARRDRAADAELLTHRDVLTDADLGASRDEE